MILQPINTLFTGQNLIELPEVESTNDFAIELLKSTAIPEGSAILTQKQTKGRGQREQNWESESGKNITVSFIFHPRFLTAARQFNLNICVSLGVLDFVDQVLNKEAVSIKWPNDIYFNNKKIGGILIENTIQGNSLQTSVVGIGININQTEFHSEAPNPASFKTITGQDYNIYESFSILCTCLEARYLQLKAGKETDMKMEYIKNLFQFDVYRDYLIKGELYTCRITGVSDSGRLLLEACSQGNEEYRTFEADLKEVKFIL